MKTLIPPPARVKTEHGYLFCDGDDFTTAWSVVHEVAPGYRYWASIVAEANRDLLRFAAILRIPVFVGVKAGKTPFFYFHRELVAAWIEAGGRAWIIAELEARGSKRVVAFRPQRA